MANGEQPAQSEGGQQPQDGEKMITLPKSALERYTRRLNGLVRKAKEEAAAERQRLQEENEKFRTEIRKEIEDHQKRPLKGYADDFSEEMKKQIADKIMAGAANNALAEVLPGEIKKQGGVIAELTKREVEKQAPDIVERVVDKRVIDIINRTDGAQPATLEQTIARRVKHKSWTRWRNRIGAGAAALVLGTAAYFSIKAYIDSNKRTAESAVGTANAALEVSRTTNKEFKGYKTEVTKWQTTHDETKTKEDDARVKATGELEKRLTGKIAEKADKGELTTQIADVKKNYTTLNAIVNAELAKNNAREEAYGEFKKLADATKKSLDELAKNYDEFSKKTASKEDVDAEFARIGKNLADTEGNIKKYGGLIVQLQTESGANSKENADLRKLYDRLLKNYQAIADRVKKLEEKPAGNGNYQPPARDR